MHAGHASESLDGEEMSVEPKVVRSNDVNGSGVAPKFLLVTQNAPQRLSGQVADVEIQQPTQFRLLEWRERTLLRQDRNQSPHDFRRVDLNGKQLGLA